MGFPIPISPFTGRLDLGKLLNLICAMKKIFILHIGYAINTLNIMTVIIIINSTNMYQVPVMLKC